MCVTRWDDLLVPLTVEHVLVYAKELMDNDFPWAWAFVQEPSFVGLGVVTKERLYLRNQVDWARLTDLRIFTNRGEWHLWQKGSQRWGRRLRLRSAETEVISERHPLWGTKVAQVDDLWWVAHEQRGFSLFVPAMFTEQDLPLCLEVNQVADYDRETHLAQIVDAFLTGLSTACGKPLHPALPELKGGSWDV